MSKNQQSVVIESMEPRVLFDASQLTETIISSTLPASISDHATAKGAVTVTVANNSPTTQKEKISVDIVITTAGFLDLQSFSTRTLSAKAGNISLAEGQSTTFVVPTGIKKGSLADATYTLYAVAADRSEAVSQSAAGPTLTVAPPFIQLAETETFLKLPASVATGAKFNVTNKVAITNSGSGDSTDPIIITVYATPDGLIADGTAITTTPARKVKIKAGKTTTVSVKMPSFPPVAAGTYELVTQVTQANSVTTSTNPATAPTITVT